MTRENIKIRGFTLIELVVAIVVMSIGVTAFLLLINQTVRGSADPMVVSQANAITQSYMEEVMLTNFCDPDLSNDCPVDCAAGCNVCTSFSNQVGESRPTFDDVCDYNNLPDTVVRNKSGAPIAALNNYSVTVTVDDTGQTLNGLSSDNGQVVRIDVNVTHSNGSSATLTGYKTNY